MPVYWALGYHLCRWGYNTSDSTWDVVKKMRNYGIPQVKRRQQTVICEDLRWLTSPFFFFFLGCPVEWHRLHGPVHGLHLRPNKVWIVARPGEGSSRSRPALRHDPGNSDFYWPDLLIWRNLVESLTQMVIVPGFSTRTLGSAALSPRAPIGRLTRGWREGFLSRTLKEKHW